MYIGCAARNTTSGNGNGQKMHYRLDKVPTPVRVFILTDSVDYNVGKRDASNTSVGYPALEARHTIGANFQFADGHVERLPLTEISTVPNYAIRHPTYPWM